VFVADLIDFTEFREARPLRKKMLSSIAPTPGMTAGKSMTIALQPESDALWECMKTVQKKL
jgi:hypothetical protein